MLRAKFKVGALDYALGGHPLWEVCRAAYQVTRKPYLFGGLVLFAGYVAAAARGEQRPVSRDLVEFRRREQMRRLRKFITGRTWAQSRLSMSRTRHLTSRPSVPFEG